MDRHEREPQVIEQESNSVPEKLHRSPQESFGIQWWLQKGLESSKPLGALSGDDVRSLQRFTSAEQKNSHPAYQMTSQISKQNRIEDWNRIAPGVDLEGRRAIWDESMEDYFKSNEDFFNSVDGWSAREFLIRLGNRAGFSFDPVTFTKDTSRALFDRYFAGDSAESLVGQFIEDVFKAEGLMRTGLKDNDFDMIQNDREIIWTLAHIFGGRSSEIITHLLDSEVTIVKISEGVESIDGFLQRLHEEEANNVADHTVQPDPVEKSAGEEVAIDKRPRHWDMLGGYFAPGEITMGEARALIEKFNQIYDSETEKPDDYLIGDQKGTWMVQSFQKLGFKIETAEDAGVMRIITFERPTPVIIEQPAPAKKTRKGVPPPAPAVFPDNPRGAKLIVNSGDVSEIEEAPEALAITNPIINTDETSKNASVVSVPEAEVRTGKINGETPLNVHAGEEDLDDVVARLCQSLNETGNGYFHVPGISILDEEVIDKISQVMKRLKTQKESISLTKWTPEIVNRSDIRGGRIVQVDCVIKKTRRTIRPARTSEEIL